ncbi:MAG: HAD-IIIA family hydrolase [Candidatus Giovannonibacteria bacterium]|nr:MAG: HAD-IIIA family hydrolase [Candidatus Giovannonibacteria bacterium]
MAHVGNKAVFFDRDGVILKAVVDAGVPRPPYSVAEYKEKSGIMPGAKEAVEAVRRNGFLAILATNQPDIRYGRITKEDWQWIQNQIVDIPFDDIFICFHGRDDGCECKKPKPGMLIAAAKKWGIDLKKTFMVGDSESDVKAGQAAGCKIILIDHEQNKNLEPDFRVTNLSEVVKLINENIY